MAISTLGSRGNAGYAGFRAALLDGRLRPGATLTQAELCEILGMSLSPLRDTLTLLEADGLVTVRHRAGVTVLTPDVAFIRENFQFRSLIEREAMPQFVEVVADQWIADTIAAHERVRAVAGDRSQISQIEQSLRVLDWDFHGAIVAAAHNHLIAETHFRLQENLKLARVLNQDFASPSKAIDAIGEHLVILDRLSRRDADGAVDALEAHFRAAVHRVFGG